MEKNNKVPVAILSCFLIAFILQGILKISGIFIFEKALTWQIFELIDNNKFLYIVNYFITVFIVVYCLSFVFTTKWYSKKWYHYVVMAIPTIIVVSIKAFILMSLEMQILTDILLYVIVPLIVYFTTDKKDRMFEKLNIFNIVTIISLQLLCYYCYLGLTYWSVLLNSLIPALQIYTSSSTVFLIFFEVYMAEILMMLSFNFVIKKFKHREE